MLILLDIDGVMVSGAGWRKPELLKDGFPAFTHQATEALARILTPKTKIILSTSHRDRYSVDQWKEIFKARGLSVSNLDKLGTYNISSSNRVRDIQEWFDKNPDAKNFIIIDDDTSLNSLPSNLKDHLVLTPSVVGLTYEMLKPYIHKSLGKKPKTRRRLRQQNQR